jgi:sugar phosphate isomerase/epimerase
MRAAATGNISRDLTFMTPSRRDFLKALAAGPLLAIPQRPAAVTAVNGVVFGVETFSFHDLPPAGDPQLIPTIVKNLQALGIAECEIMSGHIEPFASVMTGWWVQSRRSADFARLREEARQWRLTVPMTYYRDIRRRFEDAGLRMYFYNVNFNETFTDAERDRTFEAARELGAEGFSSSTVLSEARRLVPFVQKHKMFVAMHNHNNLVDPDQFATPASFETALTMSPWFYVTLDIGHFTAGNQDAVGFIRRHHDRIVNIHVRDRKRNNGPNRPFGQGDTPISDALRLIRDNRYPIRCYLEYEYGSFRPSLDEVQTCFDYCKRVLAS